MFSQTSRYAREPVLEMRRADDVAVRYVLPRILPSPDDVAMATRHRATDSERIDSLAYRYLANASAWWILAEANRAMHPAELPGKPGDEMIIPVPGTRSARG
jgi:hypothetical protein